LLNRDENTLKKYCLPQDPKLVTQILRKPDPVGDTLVFVKQIHIPDCSGNVVDPKVCSSPLLEAFLQSGSLEELKEQASKMLEIPRELLQIIKYNAHNTKAPWSIISENMVQQLPNIRAKKHKVREGDVFGVVDLRGRTVDDIIHFIKLAKHNTNKSTPPIKKENALRSVEPVLRLKVTR